MAGKRKGRRRRCQKDGEKVERQSGRDGGRGKLAKRLLKKHTHTQGWFLTSAIINEGEGRRSGSVKKRTESSSRR